MVGMGNNIWDLKLLFGFSVLGVNNKQVFGLDNSREAASSSLGSWDYSSWVPSFDTILMFGFLVIDHFNVYSPFS